MGIFEIFKTFQPKTKNPSLAEQIYRAFDVLRHCDQYKNTAECVEAISRHCENPSLAWEIYCIVPIVIVRKVIPTPQYIDEVTLCEADGTETKFLLSQTVLFDVLEKEFSKIIGSTTDEELEQLLWLSAEFNAINQALHDGSQIEDLLVGGTYLMAPANYEMTGFRKKH